MEYVHLWFNVQSNQRGPHKQGFVLMVCVCVWCVCGVCVLSPNKPEVPISHYYGRTRPFLPFPAKSSYSWNMSGGHIFRFFHNISNLNRQDFFAFFLDHSYLCCTSLGQRERWAPINHHWTGLRKVSC